MKIPLTKQQVEIIEQVAWMLKLRDEKHEFLKRQDLDDDVKSMTERDIVKIHKDMKQIFNLD